MSDGRNLRFEVGADGVALLTIDVVDRPMNVFTPGFSSELRDAVAQIAGRADVRGAILSSGKAGAFLAGADLKDFVGAHALGTTAAQAAERIALSARVLRELERCGKPVVAAINGLALGGGYELCLACHHRILLDEPAAVVGLPEVSVGLMPGGGGTQRLPRMIGIERALPLLLSGRHVAPREALSLGLVDALASADDLIAAARRWVLDHPEATQPWDRKGFRVPGDAGALAAHAERSFGLALAAVRRETQDNLPAPAAILSAVYEGTQLPIDRGLHVESLYFGPLLAGPVARNLMRTLFIHRGAALKRVRGAELSASAPSQVPAARIGILNAEAMAPEIVQAASAAGIELIADEGNVAAACCQFVLRRHCAVASMPLMEVVCAAPSPPGALARALDFVRRLRHVPIVVHDPAGSYVQRIRAAYIEEGIAMLLQGVAPALIENAARQAGFATGPLAAADKESLEALLPMREAGRPGGASGHGFYEREGDGTARLWPGLREAYPPAAAQPGVEELRQRLLCRPALVSVACLAQGIVTEAAAADLGAVLGLGYPSWTGGTLSYIETFGLPGFVEHCDLLAERHGERFRPTAPLRERAGLGLLFHAPMAVRD